MTGDIDSEQALLAAKVNIADWLLKAMLSPELSTLPPDQQVALAGNYPNGAPGVSGPANPPGAALAVAQSHIAKWCLDKVLNPETSTLTPSAKLELARRLYSENLVRARSGELSGLAKFTILADAYLQQARNAASSKSYATIFIVVTEHAAALVAWDNPPQ